MMKRFLIFVAFAANWQMLQATPLELVQPYNFMIEHYGVIKDSRFQLSLMTEIGHETQGYDGEGLKVDALSIYESRQNLLGLFQGFGSESQFNQTINALAGGAGGGINNDDNGWFTPTGKFSASQISMTGSYEIWRDFTCKIHIPFYKVKLENVKWAYAGTNTTFSDAAIQSKLADEFESDAKKLFNLDVGGWEYKHIGDVTCMFDFTRDFPQGRTLLRNVRAHLRLGLTLPTGQKVDENKLMYLPAGNDGSVSLPFGAGLDINLARYFQCGFRGQFQYFWGSERQRRVATFTRQTTLLLPVVTDTFKDFGFEQKFNLYAQAFNIFGGVSLKAAYEYTKKSEDTVTVLNPGFNYELINSAKNLDEKTSHNVLLSLVYDSGFTKRDDKLHPQLTGFIKIPFYGSYTNLATTFGFQMSFDW